MKRLMVVSKIIKGITSHPLSGRRKIYATLRFFYWQLSQAVYKREVKFRFVNNTRLLASKGRASATGNYYTGLLDFPEMGFILHTLRKEDLFGDVGANVGVFSVLASSTGAASIAVEPILHTSEVLKRNVALNNFDPLITHLQLGVGDKECTLKFINNFDVINGVCKHQDQEENTIDVQVSTLDKIFRDKVPAILKIDVEGYEPNVLEGAKEVFTNKELKAVIIETNVNVDEVDNVHLQLTEYGFKIYDYLPFERKLVNVSNYDAANTLYVRDIDWATERIATADKFSVWGMKI